MGDSIEYVAFECNGVVEIRSREEFNDRKGKARVEERGSFCVGMDERLPQLLSKDYMAESTNGVRILSVNLGNKTAEVEYYPDGIFSKESYKGEIPLVPGNPLYPSKEYYEVITLAGYDTFAVYRPSLVPAEEREGGADYGLENEKQRAWDESAD